MNKLTNARSAQKGCASRKLPWFCFWKWCFHWIPLLQKTKSKQSKQKI